MASIDALPLETITEIFLYLSRKDRMLCSLVCTKWRDALNSPCLWKNITVHLDTDLAESSTAIATALYHAYFKSMEFCWTHPRLPVRWMQQGLLEFSKRVCRYFMILQNSSVQLNSIRIVDWYEVPKFKKIVYHLCKFLRSQTRLIRLSFSNVNFDKAECAKLLASCLESADTIQYLDVGNCHHANPSTHESSVAFASYLEQLLNLRTLRIDYSALSGGTVMKAITASKNTTLQDLEIIVSEHDNLTNSISEQAWKELRLRYPLLRVALYLKNSCHFENVYGILKESVPLTTFSLTCGRIWDQSRSRRYRQTILLLINNYYDTLENVHLQINYNREVLDDLLLTLIRKCTNLKRLDFHGVIGSIDLLKEIYQKQTESISNRFKYFCVSLRNMDSENRLVLTKLHEELSGKLQKSDVDFEMRHTCYKNMVYVYY